MQDIIFYPRNTFIQQCCWNCNSNEFHGIKIPIYTNGMYYSINVCENKNCIERCISDLFNFFNDNRRIYIIFQNKFIDFLKENDLIKVNVPRSDGTISSWYCYGCKYDFSSFLVFENLSSSSLSKSVKYEKLKEINDDNTLFNLKNMMIKSIDNMKSDILKNNDYIYKEYNLLCYMKEKHKIIMTNIIYEIENLPLIGIKYLYEFKTIYKPKHNDIMKIISTEIEHLPPFSNFNGGINYLKAKELFDSCK